MSAWSPFVPTHDAPWNWQRVVHLHRRAGFGATWSKIQRDVESGPKRAIDRVLAGDDGLPRDDFEEMSQIIGDAAVSTGEPNRLKAWWMYRLMFSCHPLREKLTLLWHNHFATSNLKVKDLALMRRQNELLREHGLGPFGELLSAVLKDGAMLIWLDANSNRKERPNENLARELMELFTLGIGNYSENDVKHAARSLTGWTVYRGNFRMKQDRHDAGDKTILGQTQAFDGDGLTRLLLSQPATSQRLAWRLCRCFMGENVADDAALNDLASGLRENNLEIGWAVDRILRSQLFFSNANICSRVSSPVEFMLSAVRALEMSDQPPSSMTLAEWSGRLGQELFYPPNVGGWNGGRAWLSSRTIIGRSNFAAELSEGQLRSPPAPPGLESLVLQHCGKMDVALAADLFGRLLCGKELAVEDRNRLVTQTQSLPESSRLNRLIARILSQPFAFMT